MARYTGPKWRISRREKYDIFGNSKWRRRDTLPGVHPVSKGRPSNYSIQFREKQKVKRMYGLMERQFSNLYTQASKATGNTGLRLLQLLEMRLDNVTYRLGYAKSLTQARQFVSHGHIKVNGKKVNIPSYTVKIGDEITLHDKFLNNDFVKIILAENKQQKKMQPKWLDNNKVVAQPSREMIDQGIREQLIIELYSRQ
jgi:small subunit ribosomal protein S4